MGSKNRLASLHPCLRPFVIFQMVKMVNRLRNATPPAPAATPDDVILLREIRDALKK